VHVVLGADATMANIARAAVAASIAQGRRPPLPADANNVDAAAWFEQHLSKYSTMVIEPRSISETVHCINRSSLMMDSSSLAALNPDEKVLDLGSRNFFLCAIRF
jgi:hypothetical protein